MKCLNTRKRSFWETVVWSPLPSSSKSCPSDSLIKSFLLQKLLKIVGQRSSSGVQFNPKSIGEISSRAHSEFLRGEMGDNRKITSIRKVYLKIPHTWKGETSKIFKQCLKISWVRKHLILWNVFAATVVEISLFSI